MIFASFALGELFQNSSFAEMRGSVWLIRNLLGVLLITGFRSPSPVGELGMREVRMKGVYAEGSYACPHLGGLAQLL